MEDYGELGFQSTQEMISQRTLLYSIGKVNKNSPECIRNDDVLKCDHLFYTCKQAPETREVNRFINFLRYEQGKTTGDNMGKAHSLG